MTHFLHKSSPNTCKEQIKDKPANRITTFLLHSTKDFLTKKKLLEILQPRTSKSLIEMSRAEPSHRQKNQNFDINLKRKLRLELWPEDDAVTCAYGQRMDIFGDHAFCCSHVKKTTMSNEIRDGIIRLFKHILPTVRMISTPSAVKKGLPNLLRVLPTIRPFNLSIKLDHLLGNSMWRSPLNRIGFHVYVIFSNTSSSTKSQANKKSKVKYVCVMLKGRSFVGEVIQTKDPT